MCKPKTLNIKKKIIFIFTFLFTAYATYATSTQIEIDTSTINSQFFIAIISGVLLALVFQIILTALSVALGISMVGNLKEAYVKNKVNPDNISNENYNFNQDYGKIGVSTGVKVSSAFGIWSLLTTAISLFGASALALNLSFFGNVASNLTVALVIWALFFLILFYLETRIVNTVIGGLVTTATSGLKSTANMVQSLFASSREKKVENMVGSTIDKIRKEFDVNLNTSELTKTLDKFLNKVDNKLPSYDTLKSDLEKIAKSSKSKNTAGKYMAIQQVLTKAIDEAGNSKNLSSKGKVGQLKNILTDLKSAYSSNSSTAEGIKDIITDYTSLEKQQIDDKISELKDYISNATPKHFSKDALNEDFNKILTDPKSAGAVLSSKFENFNKDKIFEVLSNNTRLDKSELHSYADKVVNTISNARKIIEENDLNTIKTNADKSIGDFFNSTNRDELDYDDLKSDLNAIYDNPKDSISIIKSRLNKVDADTIKAIVTNNKYINEDQIDNISSQINSTIDSLKSKFSSIEHKAHEQLKMAKRKAVIKAEHARATAASAAWWLVITVVLSAGASMLGAWIDL